MGLMVEKLETRTAPSWNIKHLTNHLLDIRHKHTFPQRALSLSFSFGHVSLTLTMWPLSRSTHEYRMRHASYNAQLYIDRTAMTVIVSVTLRQPLQVCARQPRGFGVRRDSCCKFKSNVTLLSRSETYP